MAIITISRQVAALGDEVASAAAKELGYTFVTRKQIEQRIVELGFPKEKLEKYDERKPGFFASLAKGRDEYLNYLQYAVLEAASKGNCILIGRGAFVILEDIPNLIPLRLIAKNSVRLERLKKEFNWNDKQAQQRINESAENRRGFHRDFFNTDHENPEHYILTLNSGMLSEDEIVKIIVGFSKLCTEEQEKEGAKKIKNRLVAQELTNKLLYEHKLNINFLHAATSDSGDEFTLQGVTDSQAVIEKAIEISAKILPSCSIKSDISLTQDFKTFK